MLQTIDCNKGGKCLPFARHPHPDGKSDGFGRVERTRDSGYPGVLDSSVVRYLICPGPCCWGGGCGFEAAGGGLGTVFDRRGGK